MSSENGVSCIIVPTKTSSPSVEFQINEKVYRLPKKQTKGVIDLFKNVKMDASGIERAKHEPGRSS